MTAGSAPANSVTIGPTTNRVSGSPYAYDANGNMTNDGLNGSMVYDAENRLVSLNAGSATYSYDGNNLRVKKVAGATTTVYIYSGTKAIAEYENGAAPGAPTREYVYAGSGLLAKIESGATAYYHADHLSVRLMTDSSGNVIGQQGHYPFGEAWYQTSTTTKWLFTTYERDAESGNDYAVFRYDVNRLGRFASPDPIAGAMSDPQSWNRYAYVRDDPVNLTDPLGMEIQVAPLPHPAQPPSREGGSGGGFSESEVPSGACVLDGIDTPCGITYGLIGVGAADICPDNICSGFIGGQWRQFRCSLSGLCGYQTPQDFFAKSNECGDHFCDDAEFNQYVKDHYQAALDAQKKALIDKINANCKSDADSRRACDIAIDQIEHMQGKLQGGNYDFKVTLDPNNLVCGSSRCNGIHIKTDRSTRVTYTHLDSAHPFDFSAGFFGFLGGFFEHVAIDGFLGNTVFVVLPRPFHF